MNKPNNEQAENSKPTDPPPNQNNQNTDDQKNIQRPKMTDGYIAFREHYEDSNSD